MHLYPSDLTVAGSPSSSTFLRGDDKWATVVTDTTGFGLATQQMLNDSIYAVRLSIPTLSGYATNVSVGDTAITVRALIPLQINDSANALRAYEAINLADTAAALWLRMLAKNYLTSNQVITLSGPVSGTGATSITTTIGIGAITNGMLANSTTTINGIPAILGTSVTINAVPSGNAGGDLVGSYPNPTITTVNSTPATYGNSTNVAQISVNAKGQATTVSNIPINYAWSNLTSIPATTLIGDIISTIVPGTSGSATLAIINSNIGAFGSASSVGTFTVNGKGLITAASNVSILSNSLDQFATPVVNVSWGSNKIINLANPTNPQDASTKYYVDAVAAGLDPKASVYLATTTALPTNIYNNGASGIGATLTAVGTGYLIIDNDTALINERILVKNEASAINNGIYAVTVAGNNSTPYTLTRSTDANTGSQIYGAYVFVTAGLINKSTGWVNADTVPITVGVNNVLFSQFSGTGTYIAGSNINFIGNSINLTSPITGAVWNGTALTSSYVGSLTGGQVGISGLSASGAASSSTYLRGDNMWSALPTFVSSLTASSPLIASVSSGTVAVSVNTITATSVLANTTTVNATPAQSITYSPLFGTSNNLVSRDANGNTHANNFESSITELIASATTNILTAASSRYQTYTTGSHAIIQLPDATTLHNGHPFEIYNDASGFITVTNNGGTTLFSILNGGRLQLQLRDNSTSDGVWSGAWLMPANASYGSGGLTITGTANATQFITSGATSSQFVKGDGSLDGTTYLSGIVPIANGGTNNSSFTSGSALFFDGTKVNQDNSNFYYNIASHILNINTNGDFGGTNSLNVYGQIDMYQTNSAQGAVNDAITMPGTSTSSSRGTGLAPTINNSGDIIGNNAFWDYSNTGGVAGYSNIAGTVGKTFGTGGTNGLGGETSFYVKQDNAKWYWLKWNKFRNSSWHVSSDTIFTSKYLHMDTSNICCFYNRFSISINKCR